jgi:hypothetical protein
LIAAILSLPVIAPAASIAEQPSYDPQPLPTVEIPSTEAVVGTGGWFKVGVLCVAPEGITCSGTAAVIAAGIRPGAAQTVPLAFRRHYSLAAGSERAIAIRLRSFGASDLEMNGSLRVSVHVHLINGYLATKRIVLRPRRASEALDRVLPHG